VFSFVLAITPPSPTTQVPEHLMISVGYFSLWKMDSDCERSLWSHRFLQGAWLFLSIFSGLVSHASAISKFV
jgi:hypothetical protein